MAVDKHILDGFDVSGSSAATFAKDVNAALEVNLWFSILLFLSVVVPMVYFAWKYREKNVKNEDIENVTHHTGLEIAWTVIPTIILMVFFWYGYISMKALRTMPDSNDAITIKVEGSKWKWLYEYPANANGFVHKPGGAYTKPEVDENGKIIENGTLGISALYVPVDTNIILEMTAPLGDVIHSFFVPAFRMKEDVVPGRITKQWFKSDKVGEYDVECAEYCGTDHSAMYSRVVVLPKAEYEAWFNSSEDTPKGNYAQGGDVVLHRYGCTSCHSITTDKLLIGPSLKMRTLTKAQVLDVINNGQNKLGYAMGAMPAGLVSGADAQAVAAYVAGGMKGQKPAAFESCAGCHGEDGKGQYGTAPSLVDYDETLLRNVLTHGKKGMIGKMPEFPYVSDKEVSAIAEYLKAN
jgi:cytochrome c oxidase subunit 2